MTQSNDGVFDAKTTELIQQLPTEVQLLIMRGSNLDQEFESLVQHPKSLRGNLTELVINHQRHHKLEWQDDDFADFFGLLMVLDEID